LSKLYFVPEKSNSKKVQSNEKIVSRDLSPYPVSLSDAINSGGSRGGARAPRPLFLDQTDGPEGVHLGYIIFNCCGLFMIERV